MMGEGSDKSAVSIDVSAGAKLNVDIKTEIPTETSGRFVDSITDIFRPFSEARGLKADQIRLQREDVLIEIAKRTRQRLLIDSVTPLPVPNKLLVPFLEKASNEELDDDAMVNRWANLLAGAAAKPDSVPPRYVQILSEISTHQAHLLDLMTGKKIDEKIKSGLFSDQLMDINQINIFRALTDNFLGELKSDINLEEISSIGNNIIEWLDRPGIAIIGLHVHTIDREYSLDFLEEDGAYSDEFEIDFEIMQSLSVLSRVELSQKTVGNFDFDLHYFHLTALGADFYALCNPDKVQRNP